MSFRPISSSTLHSAQTNFVPPNKYDNKAASSLSARTALLSSVIQPHNPSSSPSIAARTSVGVPSPNESGAPRAKETSETPSSTAIRTSCASNTYFTSNIDPFIFPQISSHHHREHHHLARAVVDIAQVVTPAVDHVARVESREVIAIGKGCFEALKCFGHVLLILLKGIGHILHFVGSFIK